MIFWLLHCMLKWKLCIISYVNIPFLSPVCKRVVPSLVLQTLWRCYACEKPNGCPATWKIYMLTGDYIPVINSENSSPGNFRKLVRIILLLTSVCLLLLLLLLFLFLLRDLVIVLPVCYPQRLSIVGHCNVNPYTLLHAVPEVR